MLLIERLARRVQPIRTKYRERQSAGQSDDPPGALRGAEPHRSIMAQRYAGRLAIRGPLSDTRAATPALDSYIPKGGRASEAIPREKRAVDFKARPGGLALAPLEKRAVDFKARPGRMALAPPLG